jgi:hypothetical protein
MTGSGFSTEIYEFFFRIQCSVWFSKNIEYMNGGVLKISAVCLYPKV